MTTLAAHTEIRVQEIPNEQGFSTCCQCHRSFRAKSLDQMSVGLCCHCFDALRTNCEPVLRIHIRPRPHHPTGF